MIIIMIIIIIINTYNQTTFPGAAPRGQSSPASRLEPAKTKTKTAATTTTNNNNHKYNNHHNNNNNNPRRPGWSLLFGMI